MHLNPLVGGLPSILLFGTLVVASSRPDIVWTSPKPGDGFAPGQTIVASWQCNKTVVSPSFALCVESNGNDDCGDTIWPSVSQSQPSTYTMSIVAPNITFQESFFLKMKSDLGDYYSSPDFELAPSNLLVNKSSVMSTAATGSFSATLVTPSAQANPMSAQTAQKGPSPLAIGIPVAMLILTTIGALAFCMTRSHRQHREAGGGAAASLGPRTMGGQNSGETRGIGSGHADAAFFNLSLNKTSSELSAVEKAVCGAINTSIPARPEGQRREAKPARRTSNASSRKERPRSIIPDDDCYTVPPPRTWQRSEIGRQRTRDRAWVSERQRQRALEREYDKQWEAECRERARRRMYPRLPPHQYGYNEYDRPYPTRHSPDSWRPSEYDLDERMYGRSLTSRPYHRGPLLPDRFLSGTPPEIQQPFPNPHRSWSDPIRAPHTELYSRYDVPAEPTSSHMESDQDYDHHASLSVVSAYCMPSPMVPQEPSVSSLPPSLQAGRPGNSSTGPRLPPGLEHMAKLRPEFSTSRMGHPRFDFQDRQASQFHFSRMGPSASGSSQQREIYRSYGDPYLDIGLIRPR